MKKIELSIILLHMSNMRKEVKKGFKRTYNRDEYKEKMQLFDGAKTALETALTEADEEQEIIDVRFSIPELDFLNAFLDWYLVKLTELKDIEKGNSQIECLKSAHESLKNAVIAHA